MKNEIENPVREYLSKIGSIKSKKKAKSSRLNGRKGGRPKRVPPPIK